MPENQTALIPFAEIKQMAIAVASSGLFGMKTPEQALTMMLLAQAEGMHPITAARDYDIIQGRPAKKAEAMLRDFMKAGGKVEWHSLSDTEADATFSHPIGGVVRIAWDMARANAAELGTKPMWKKYPRQMLRSRVVSEGIKTTFPLATGGVYTPEEVHDMDPKAKPPTVNVTQLSHPQETPEDRLYREQKSGGGCTDCIELGSLCEAHAFGNAPKSGTVIWTVRNIETNQVFDVLVDRSVETLDDRLKAIYPNHPREAFKVLFERGDDLPVDPPKTQSPVKPVEPSTAPPRAVGPSPSEVLAQRRAQKVSEAQLKRMWAIAGESGWDEIDLRAYCEVNFNIKSSRELTRTQYDQLCADMQGQVRE